MGESLVGEGCCLSTGRVPGVERHNAGLLMHNFRSMQQLARASEKRLAALVGPVPAKRIRSFFLRKG